MDKLNLVELGKSESNQINGGIVLIGALFRAFDFIEALIEGHEKAWAEKCKCACK